MRKIVVALVGQPNVGKSHLINSISGANLKVGNFAGVTVEKAEALINYKNTEIRIIDLPGSYSLDDFAKDEQVTKEFLLNEDYDLILNVLDSTNLERNLYLTSELMELEKKMLIALNMSDEAQKEGINIDENGVSNILGIKAIKVSAVQKTNIDTLLDYIISIAEHKYTPSKLQFSDKIEFAIDEIKSFLDTKKFKCNQLTTKTIAIGLLKHDKSIYKLIHENPIFPELLPILNSVLSKLYIQSDTDDSYEIFADERQGFARGLALEVTEYEKKHIKTTTERIDNILINKYLGIPIFLFLMWSMFQLTFSLGELPMGWIEATFGYFGEVAGSQITNETIKSLVVDGIIGGVGTVMLFLPNIIILFIGISLLETTGYMARVAFLLDGFFHKFGLHGKSFIPLITGFGCSVPAYMAARTLKSEKDRLLTMFTIGFMSCGARLPVYVLFAGAFFAPQMAGNVLFGIYITGAIIGLLAAKILSITIFKGGDEPFVMEMPKYRIPSFRLIWFTVYSKSIMYMKKASTFILVASIFIWFISTYPKNDILVEEYNKQIELTQDKEKIRELQNNLRQQEMENTYLGIVGKSIEPLFAPLGFDWKMSIATVSGLAAKEVIVSTMGVLYSLGSDVNEESDTLKEIISKEIPFASAIAFIVFVMTYLPCLAATAVFSKEAGNRKYTIYLVIFTFSISWILSFFTYQFLSIVL